MKKYNLIILAMVMTLLFTSNLGAQEQAYNASLDSDGVQRIEIVGGEYYFKPNLIKVKINVPVEFVVKKTSGFTPHNIIIKAADAGIDFNKVLTEDSVKIKFTPSKIGKYEMYCDKQFLFFENHREKGMKGFIEVVL